MIGRCHEDCMLGGLMSRGFVFTSRRRHTRCSREWSSDVCSSDLPGFIYSRFSNPTTAMFEERMRLLEGAEASRATATGMAAVTSALLCFLRAGGHVVAAQALVGPRP